tara:strand:+ start:229 stop:609 length:381 start_codon:yes stop_codon:yes gene_type:complete
MSKILYTKNSSGAIRRARRRKPTKGYLAALIKHIKFLRSLGFKVDSKGKMKRKCRVSGLTLTAAPIAQSVEQLICNQQVRGSSPCGGTKPVHNWRLEESKNFTIAPAYNKGGYQVISKDNIKHIGK